MPIPLGVPATPEFATPEHCVEAIDEYNKRLHEMTQPGFDPNGPRAAKIASDLRYIETNLSYWLGFMIGPDGSSVGIISEVLAQIEELRTAYASVHTVPDIEGEAQKFAKAHARRPRASAREAKQRREANRAASAPPQAPEQPPLASASTGAVLSRTEAAMARLLGMDADQFRAYAAKSIPTKE